MKHLYTSFYLTKPVSKNHIIMSILQMRKRLKQKNPKQNQTAGVSVVSWVSNACVSDSGVHTSSLYCQYSISYFSCCFVLFLDFAAYNITQTSLSMKHELV